MKKFFAAAALATAALLLFTGCSAQITADISSGWFTDPATAFESTFYESLDYTVGFNNSASNTTGLTIDVDSKNSSYNITTKALSNYTVPGTNIQYSNVYYLKSTLTVSATYRFVHDGETLEWSFGGTHDTDAANEDFAPEDADSVVMEVWFTSANSTAAGTQETCPAYSPIRSVQTVRSHGSSASVIDGNKMFMSMYDFSITIDYNRTCQNATAAYTDNFADLTDEERAANEYVRKASTLFPDSRDLKDLQKNYTCVDNAQLLFIARGLAMNTDTSHTLTVVSGVANNYPATQSISCSELVNSHANFTMVNADGSESVYDDNKEEIPVARMRFALANTGSNIGENTTVTYAQRAASGANTNRCLPLHIETPYGWNIGNYEYTLEKATYQTPAEQA